jgi:(p)ppGpp synthase/HD superfamily hydrolase
VVPLLTERFEQALLYAARLHATQIRKGSGVPYISHLMAVAGLALENGGGEDEAISALLHDAVEDQGGEPTRAEIQRRFGPRVAEIVDGCTDTDRWPKPPWRVRKELHIASVAGASPSVCLVLACDKLHNVRCLVAEYRNCGDALWGRYHGGRAGTLWYYRAMLEALRLRGTSPLLEELGRAVSEFEALAGNSI